LEEYAEKYPWVLAMRTVRRSNMLLKKIEILIERTEGTRFNFGLKYYGGHTGRWSGDSGFNVQNMNKETYEGIDLRHLIKAEPDYKFVIADQAQIEARCLPWTVGDEKMMSMIREGVSVYEAHARLTMGYHRPEKLKEFDKKWYALAKARVLALGYGCGPDKFQAMARLDMYGNLDLSITDCRKIVADFRYTNPKIVQFWKKLDDDARMCKNRNYEIYLPSGRSLVYYNVHDRPGNKGYELCAARQMGSNSYEKLYGGLCCENVIQSIARDLFAWSMKNVVDAGHEVLFSVHDELVVHVPMNVDKAEIEHLMTTNLPDWASDFPLGVESVESPVYLK
jgi:DNA polymerase